MDVALVQHIVDKQGVNPALLRIWVGIHADSPIGELQLNWQLNGVPLQPLQAPSPWKDTWQVGKDFFRSGVFYLPASASLSQTESTLVLTVNQVRIARRVRHRPQQVPADLGKTLNILLLSCYHNDTDAAGKAGEILSQWPDKPDLVLLAGDQVYLDLPVFVDFKDDQAWLEQRFFQEYRKNWFGTVGFAATRGLAKGFSRILALGPIAAIPDDHEYWNNAPLQAPHIQNSWRESGRERWIKASEKALEYFQAGDLPLGTTRTIEFAPLSIFVLDTRSQRNIGGIGDTFKSDHLKQYGALIKSGQMHAFSAWTAMLKASATTANPVYGVLLTGQSLFRKNGNWIGERVADAELPDYEADYQQILQSIKEVCQAGLPLVCLTGDVHWGRILKADFGAGSAPVYEIISSPTSELDAYGLSDEKKPGKHVLVKAVDWIQGHVSTLFNKGDKKKLEDAKPKHLDSSIRNPALLALRDGNEAVMTGNMGVMLRFSRLAQGLKLHVHYIPLHADKGTVTKQGWETTIYLRPN